MAGTRTPDRVEMRLNGGTSGARPVMGDPAAGTSHYLIGNDPRKWRRKRPGYSKITYEHVYSNIDVAYYGQGTNLEYDFTLKPGGDVRGIHLEFHGQRGIKVDESGALSLQMRHGTVRHPKPLAYQGRESGRGRGSRDKRRFLRHGLCDRHDDVHRFPGEGCVSRAV